MATPKDYTAGSAAAYALIMTDMSHLPSLLRDMVPTDKIKPFCDAVSKTIIDAVDKERAT